MKADSGGKGGAGGTGGRSAESAANNAVARLKAGIDDTKLDRIRGSMRDLSVHRAGFEGLNANDVATGRVKTANSSRAFDPIKITAEVGPRGGLRFELTDGTHRLAAAREAGATRIRAQVRVETGGRTITRTAIIKIPR